MEYILCLETRKWYFTSANRHCQNLNQTIFHTRHAQLSRSIFSAGENMHPRRQLEVRGGNRQSAPILVSLFTLGKWGWQAAARPP